MKKRLSEAQFSAIVGTLNIGQQTIEIARGVLVNGLPQSHFVAALGLTKGAVSQAVSRVWAAATAALPPGYERIEAILPHKLATTVREWDASARADIDMIRFGAELRNQAKRKSHD